MLTVPFYFVYVFSLDCLNYKKSLKIIYLIPFLILSLTIGCTTPSSGPSTENIKNAPFNGAGINVVEINNSLAKNLDHINRPRLFSETFSKIKKNNYHVAPGDVLDFSIWETPPAALFSTVTTVGTQSVMNQIPTQMINERGSITFPFIGEIYVSGLNLQQIQNKIRSKLKDISNNPQVLVRLARNSTQNVTVMGEVKVNKKISLTPGKERLLDVLADAEGVKIETNKSLIQITRGNEVHSLPLDIIIRDPRQNIYLQSGDVITALYQANSFIALGATGKSDEINFEATGINLAQALGRAGGLIDLRADPKGVFIFRFEDKLKFKPLNKANSFIKGKIPVIYYLNLRKPENFFAAQYFPMKNHDILYVSNASMVEVIKLLSTVSVMTSPFTPLAYYYR